MSDTVQDTISQADRHTRRGDGINLTRAEILGGIGGYSARDQEDLIWLHGYVCDQLGGSRSRLMEAFRGMEWSTLWKIWTGKYGADIVQVMERVRKFRRKAESAMRKRFIPTIVTKRIWAVCDAVRDRSVMAMISGPTGKSKTWTLTEWKHNNNHGRAVMVTARKSGGLRVFLEDLAKALNISPNRNQYAIMHAIERSLDERNVLIVDEFARLYPTGRSGSIDAIEFIRDLHDRTGCGVVICATEGIDGLLKSGKFALWFNQFLGRIDIPLEIPRQFSRQEIGEYLAGYVDDADPDLISVARDIANRSNTGCRALLRELDRAAQAAAECGRPLSADLLTQTVEAGKKLLTIPTE